MDGLEDGAVAEILRQTRRIALVGASARPERPSNRVMRFLLEHGYGVVPVNPGLAGQALHGRRVAASLDEAGPLDMVDIFLKPRRRAAGGGGGDPAAGADGVDAAGHRRARLGGAGAAGRPRGGDGPLSGDRVAAARAGLGLGRP